MATKQQAKKKRSVIPLVTEETTLYHAYNPLHSMTSEEAEQIIDHARRGAISRLQVIYDLVEQSSLVLHMCIDRRVGMIANTDWVVKNRNIKRFRSFDGGLAKEQADMLTEQFSRAEDDGSLIPAIRTLAKAKFNGLGVIAPRYSENGLEGFDIFDPWNFAVSSKKDPSGNHRLYWNPKGIDELAFENSLEEIPRDQIIYSIETPIDAYGMRAFLAEMLGIDSYNMLVARRGLPSTFIVAPEELASTDMEMWARKASQIARGGSGAFPFGTSVVMSSIDPSNGTTIREFIEYQEKRIVLASTGGTLTSLSEATGMNSDIATIQDKVFKSLVRADASKIGDTINRSVTRHLIDQFFPGKPQLVYFDLNGEEVRAPKEYLEEAAIAHNAGLSIDKAQLEELTGYKFTNNFTSIPAAFSEEKTEEEPVEEPQETEEEKPEEKPAEIVKNSEDPVEEEPKKEVVEGAKLLKGFDAFLHPLKFILAKIEKAKSKDDLESILNDATAEIAKLENQDDTDFQLAVQNLMTKSFEDAAEKEKEANE